MKPVPIRNKLLPAAVGFTVGLLGLGAVGRAQTADPSPAVTAGAITIQPGAGWHPFDYSLEIEAGSVFDFSALADAPAGKHGPIRTTPDGHFEFKGQPGVHVKFWGVNICTQALYVDKAMADRVAERLRRSGYNVVRIHHFDRDLLRPGGLSYDIDPAQLDRLEYFIAALEKQGIYLNIDLYTLRNFSEAEATAFGWPGGKIPADRPRWYKTTLPVSDAAFDSWKKFTANLLAHRNPYTGLTWAADPAFIGICPVNEDTIIGHVKKVPELAAVYQARFAEWQETPAHRDAVARDASAAFNEFLLEIEMRNDERMYAFLHSLGVQAPLTGCNYFDTEAQAFLRERYDYVDDHDYWDMPRWLGKEWSLPFATKNADAVRASAKMPREMMPSRILGKPFIVTEYSYVWPNALRAQGGILMSAYASLQDWDGIYYFAYAGKPNTLAAAVRSGLLDLSPDPVNLLADRVAALIFRRGDVKPAPSAVCFAVNKDVAVAGGKMMWREFPKDFSTLGLLMRIGTSTARGDTILGSDFASRNGVVAVVTDPHSAVTGRHLYESNEQLVERMQKDSLLPVSANRHAVSETGQIDLSKEEGIVTVVTAKSECYVLPAGKNAAGRFAVVRNGDAAVSLSVVAVDNQPLTESRRLLVLHLTNSLNDGTRFSGPTLEQVEAWGEMPHMVQHGETEVTFHVHDPAAWQAWAVDASGRRLENVPLGRSAEGITLKANTAFKTGACLAYELVHG